MPEDGVPVTEEGAAQAAAAGSPAAPAGGGTGDMVPKERFDGLMASMNRQKAELERQIAELRAQIPAPASGEPGDGLADVERIAEEAARRAQQRVEQSASVSLGFLRDQAVGVLLKEYPYATAEDVRGENPDEWRESVKASHERVEALMKEREATVREEAQRMAQERFGVPIFISGEAGTPVDQAAEFEAKVEAARKSGDATELARLRLLGRT